MKKHQDQSEDLVHACEQWENFPRNCIWLEMFASEAHGLMENKSFKEEKRAMVT